MRSTINALAIAAQLGLAVTTLFPLVGCGPKTPSCNPNDVKWGVQLLVEAASSVNVDTEGNSLPTVVRLYQVRGELALDGIDFDTLWAAEDAKALGDAFLAMEELTVYPGKSDSRVLPLEQEATHIIAAAWFREPLGTTWYTSYEIPRRHPEVVCYKEPATKLYPNPCFYVLLDRNAVNGGAAPPAGFHLTAGTECASPKVVPGVDERDKKKRRGRKDKVDLEDPLNMKKVENPGVPKTSKPAMPKTPEVPKGSVPNMPKTPDAPKAPKSPSLP